jgi:hypothetical protein
MATKGVLKSFRFGKTEADWLVNTSKSQGITQTDLLKKIINQTGNTTAKQTVMSTVVQLQNNKPDDEVLQFLTNAGIGTVSGFLGYQLAGYIREQMNLDEDKGMQIAAGLVVGFTSIILREYTRKKS